MIPVLGTCRYTYTLTWLPVLNYKPSMVDRCLVIWFLMHALMSSVVQFFTPSFVTVFSQSETSFHNPVPLDKLSLLVNMVSVEKNCKGDAFSWNLCSENLKRDENHNFFLSDNRFYKQINWIYVPCFGDMQDSGMYKSFAKNVFLILGKIFYYSRLSLQIRPNHVENHDRGSYGKGKVTSPKNQSNFMNVQLVLQSPWN